MDIRAAKRSILALAVLTAAGCATVPESDPIVADARVAVQSARNDPQVQTYARYELDQAIATRNRMEQLIRDVATPEDVHRMAYLAQERARLAEQTARAKANEAALAAANERQRVELAARAQEADAAKQRARDAQLQAEAARDQARAAQQQAQLAQQQAANAQAQAQAAHAHAAAADAQIDVLRSQLVDLSAQPTDRGLVVALDDVMFEPARGRLQPSGVRAVRRVADVLVAHPERTIAIEAFTGGPGTTYNERDLAAQRARTIQLALIDMGIDPSRIVVRDYGDRYPVAVNGVPVAGRTVDIVISDARGTASDRWYDVCIAIVQPPFDEARRHERRYPAR
jgi:outer membrane protein OmpA-like peptidoglycan-associated protein